MIENPWRKVFFILVSFHKTQVLGRGWFAFNPFTENSSSKNLIRMESYSKPKLFQISDNRWKSFKGASTLSLVKFKT